MTRESPAESLSGPARPESGRLRVLIVAASVHPLKGSEPGLGWGWVRALASQHDLWVIAGRKEGNQAAVESCLKSDPELNRNLRIFFVDRPDAGLLGHLLPFYYYRRYRLWHLRALEVARDLMTRTEFDVLHQLNMTGFREPGYLWTLQRPFVWGPVGGTANVPLRFGSILGPRFLLYQAAKVAVNKLQLRFHRRVDHALRRTDVLVTTTSDAQAAFQRVKSKPSTVIAGAGPPPDLIPLAHGSARRRELRLSWSGVHESRKALPLLLRALAQASPEVAWHLDILGQGPLSRSWKRTARKLGIGSRVTWHGWLPRERATEIVAHSDLFAFTSLHEGMPMVVMEAMVCGVPVLCLDLCGQGDAVTDDCGVKIPVTTSARVVSQLRAAIEELALDPRRRTRLAKGAIARAKAFSWQQRAEAMTEAYTRAIANWEPASERRVRSR